jgi:hypothetical protein
MRGVLKTSQATYLYGKEDVMDYVHARKAFVAESTRVVTWLRPLNGLPFPTKSVLEVCDFDITWVRALHGDVVISLNGKPLKRLTRCGDRHAFLDMLENGRVMDIAIEASLDWQITAQSEVEVCVRGWLDDTPTFGIAPGASGMGEPRYYALSNVEAPVIRWYEGIDLSDVRDTELPIMGGRHSITKLWSTRWSHAEQIAATEAFRCRADEEVRTFGERASLSDTDF